MQVAAHNALARGVKLSLADEPPMPSGPTAPTTAPTPLFGQSPVQLAFATLPTSQSALANPPLKGWLFIAQRLLFRNVNLSTQTAYIVFQKAVDRASSCGCMLCDAVVRMKVVLDQIQRYRLSH